MGVCGLIKTGIFARGPLFVLISVAVLFACGAAFAASPNPPPTRRQSLRSYIGESAKPSDLGTVRGPVCQPEVSRA